MVELNNSWVQLTHWWVEIQFISYTFLHTTTFRFYTPLCSSSLPPLYSPFLHSLNSLSLTHFYPLPTFPQMTSPPSLYIHPLSTSPIWVNSFFNPSLPSTYISSYDYSPFDTPTLCSMFPFYPLYLFAYHKKLLWSCSSIAIGLPTGHTRTRPYE